MPLIEIKQITPYLYLMDENHEATGYVLIGRERAAVIDTMYGKENVRTAAESVTDLPLMVINTHGHPDHIGGNVFFEKAWMNPTDLPVAEPFIAEREKQEDCRRSGLKMPPFASIREGDVIDLGGRSLTIYALPGHTPGSTVLLDREDRILFTGDSVNHHLWMQLDCSSSMAEAVEGLKRLLWLENDADFIAHGHSHTGFDDISLMRCLLNGMQEIIDGKTKQDTSYHWFGGVGKYHPFSCVEGKHYTQEEHGICY